jgi:hypothetical protein
MGLVVEKVTLGQIYIIPQMLSTHLHDCSSKDTQPIIIIIIIIIIIGSSSSSSSNVGPLTSRNPMGLHGLEQGYLYLLYFTLLLLLLCDA